MKMTDELLRLDFQNPKYCVVLRFWRIRCSPYVDIFLHRTLDFNKLETLPSDIFQGFKLYDL